VVRAAHDGDERAFRELYRAVQPGLLRYLRALVGEDAEDVASETWLHIVRDLATFNGGGDDFRAWSATIARHRALDHLRARSRRPQVSIPAEALDDRPGDADTAARALEALSTSAAIALIATLPREQAEAVLLRVVVGLDANGAGRVLGKRAGAVRTSAYRGLRRLADMLDHHRSPINEDPVENADPP
jgi:RNA polymerase sigma-70 factor (ECF subfamily)